MKPKPTHKKPDTAYPAFSKFNEHRRTLLAGTAIAALLAGCDTPEKPHFTCTTIGLLRMPEAPFIPGLTPTNNVPPDQNELKQECVESQCNPNEQPTKE